MLRCKGRRIKLAHFFFNPSTGDMDKLDPYVRRKMAQKLDPTTGGGADWRELGRRLGLGTLENAFAIHSSPTTQVLAQYEVSMRENVQEILTLLSIREERLASE